MIKSNRKKKNNDIHKFKSKIFVTGFESFYLILDYC